MGYGSYLGGTFVLPVHVQFFSDVQLTEFVLGEFSKQKHRRLKISSYAIFKYLYKK